MNPIETHVNLKMAIVGQLSCILWVLKKWIYCDLSIHVIVMVAAPAILAVKTVAVQSEKELKVMTRFDKFSVVLVHI